MFHSVAFLLAFVPAALLLFYGAGRFASTRAARVVLLVVSVGFYAWHEADHVPLLLSSIAVNFALVRAVERWRSPWLLAAGILTNVTILAYYKACASDAAGAAFSSATLSIPLAISFFTLEQIACLVDVHRGNAGRIRPLTYALFVGFFPHLVAGPIVRYRYLADQLESNDLGRFHADRFREGLPLIAIGLSKKVLLADPLAEFVNPVFGAASLSLPLSSSDARWAVLAYALQLYLDFSGYCDIALGLARMFGITLPENFRAPYRSTSLPEFWRRWHVTLHDFFRDYVFVPLCGGKTGRSGRVLASVVVVFALSGLWHGMGTTYLLWGLAHGVLVACARSVRFDRGPASSVWRAMGVASTFGTVALLLVLFRSASVDAAEHLWNAALFPSDAESLLSAPLDRAKRALLVVASAAVVFVAPGEAIRRGLEAPGARGGSLYPVTYGVALAVALFFSLLGGSHEFIYFQF